MSLAEKSLPHSVKAAVPPQSLSKTDLERFRRVARHLGVLLLDLANHVLHEHVDSDQVVRQLHEGVEGSHLDSEHRRQGQDRTVCTGKAAY